jgi:hypothetical protein
MRIIIVGLILAVLINVGIFAAAKNYPAQADAVAGAVCGTPLGDWVCRADEETETAAADADANETTIEADTDVLDKVEVADDGGNRFSCRLTGCCSGKGGPDVLDVETGHVMCTNGEPSPTCFCDRITRAPMTPTPNTQATAAEEAIAE